MNKQQATSLGSMLRQRRQSLGLSVRQVEAATDMHNTTISRIETGSFNAPQPDKLARIAQVLGLSVGEVFSQAGYLVADDLPDYGTYLRTKHPELPEADWERLTHQFAELLGSLGLVSTLAIALEGQTDERTGVPQ